ncbi:hypothetical protein [Bradyrhizobium sp. JYMT SZCCT0428]|uniref:hypothetical protein n=1 Tax=Bradyrhizobium sp. JYMT SZCCT0428 TaxID=2807673 RepID=UPI001BAC1297|nr:hypothetical protein [Bradyrhizobium sp. JYMT SZCCT0428]MBR1150072.1 hypothetical protein [Bradyrhizobium sp. JYMT SZCCT0428]
MADLTRRGDLDRPLNAAEFDANIDNFDERLLAIEDAETEFPIEDITAAGDQLTFELANDTSKSVTIPVPRYNPRIYAGGAVLAKYDVFPFNGSLWLVIWPHTAAAEFVAGANDGLGHDYYFELLPNPGNALPEGGELGQLLLKLSGTNFDIGWRFLNAIHVAFDPSSESDLTSDTVAEALEELEALIASAVGGVAFEATEIDYSPSSASALAADNVGDALDEIAERSISDFAGNLSPVQSRNAVLALDTFGTVALDPDLAEVFSVTPTTDITLDAVSAPEGARVTLIVTTVGTSSYNITFGANFVSAGVLASGTVNAKTFSIEFVGNGVKLVETGRTAAM